MSFAVRRLSSLAAFAALGAGAVGLSPLASTTAYAADAPTTTTGEVTVAWTPPEALHELYWPHAETATLTNNGTKTLSLVEVRASNSAGAVTVPSPRQYTWVSDCPTLAPGATCTVKFDDPRLIGDAPGPTTITITAVLKDASGRQVTGTVAHTIPVVDDKPQPYLNFVVWQPIGGDGHLRYSQTGAASRMFYEPITTVSAHSQLLGDLMDPANPLIHRTGDHMWETTFLPRAGVPYHDVVTSTYADDEGNLVSRTDNVDLNSEPAAQPSFDVRLDVAPGSSRDVPETGDRRGLAVTVTNTGNTDMTLTRLSTGDGRELLDASGQPDGYVTCSATGPVAPGKSVTCTYATPTLGGAPGTTSTQTVTATVHFTAPNADSTQSHTASTSLAITDVLPDVSISLVPGATKGATREATLFITGLSKEAAILQDVRIDTPASFQVTSCTGPETIDWADFRACTGVVKFTGKQHASVPATITVVVKDDEGNLVTRTLTTTITKR